MLASKRFVASVPSLLLRIPTLNTVYRKTLVAVAELELPG